VHEGFALRGEGPRLTRGCFQNIRELLGANVFFLGLVSLFTDLSSEMIYPLLPIFFTGLVPPAMAAIYIGLMDGIADTTASLLKIYAGKLSDTTGRRKPFALAGYGLSSLARPAMALATLGGHVVALRVLDRIGKGVRTSPRDALLSTSADPKVRGLAFSFHRMMDHMGAVGGPVLACAFLFALLGQGTLWQQGSAAPSAEEMVALRWLFALALIPGLFAMLTLWRGVHEVPQPTQTRVVPDAEGRSLPTARLPSRFIVFLGAVTLFGLGNSSDLFLVFYAQTHFGLGPGWVIVLWILLHVSKITFSLPGGRFSDRVGRRPAILIGWAIYIAVYMAFPFASQLWIVCALLIVYGAYYGMTEGAERALVADFVPMAQRGKAYGFYHAAIGLSALPASLLFGLFWARLGPARAFGIGASLALAALLVLMTFLSTHEQPLASENRT